MFFSKNGNANFKKMHTTNEVKHDLITCCEYSKVHV